VHLALGIQVLIEPTIIAAFDGVEDAKHDVRAFTASHIDMLAHRSRI
jgi:hypothetical protein